MKKRATHHHGDPDKVSVFVLTVSDTRTPETDESGRTILEQLRGEKHEIAGYAIVKDQPAKVLAVIRKAISQVHLDGIIVNGGTGISTRDSTVEALATLFEKTLTGFGEVFRNLSFAEVGAQAVLSRATAGVYKKKIIFLIPGSPKAVRLAMNKLILPLLSHVVGQLRL